MHKCPFTIIAMSCLYYFKENVCSVYIRIVKSALPNVSEFIFAAPRW